MQAALSSVELSALIGLVYQGPLERTPWAGLLEHMRSQLDATCLTLVLRNPESGRAGLIVKTSEEGTLLPDEESYGTHYHGMCPFTAIPFGEVTTGDELLGASAWLAHDFYRQYLKPLNLRHILAMRLRTDGGDECGLFACRGHEGSPYDESDKALLSVVLPHLNRAVSLHSTLDVLESERTLYADTIDRMQVGNVVLDEEGKILECNGAAKRLLDADHGLRASQGVLQAHCPVENRRLQLAIRTALRRRLTSTDDCTEAAVLTRPDGKVPLSVLIRPIPLSYSTEDRRRRRPALAVFIRDPAGSHASSRCMLRTLFRLTPAETEVALLLVDGLTLDEAAGTLGVMKNTVRAHLRSVFAKTGATRQSGLVKILLNSVVSMV